MKKLKGYGEDAPRSPSGKASPTVEPTEHARKVGTEVIRGEDVEHRLGRGGGNRAPFNGRKRSV